MVASVTKKPNLRSACDRCYKLKERCERETTSALCVRCKRLGLACAAVRPVRPAGRVARRDHETEDRVSRTALLTRKPREQQLEEEQCTQPGTTQPGTGTVDACLDALPDVSPEEKELLLFLLGGRPDSLDGYVVCSSFSPELQRSLAAQLPAAEPLLKHAYLACAVALKRLHSGPVVAGGADDNAAACFGYIAKAMRALRSLSVSRPEDTVLCHTLGAVLALSIYSVIGVGVPDVSRYCLGTTDPFAGTAMSGARDDPWQGFLVLVEIMDCLVYRRKPAARRIQAPASAEVAVDRRLGLCLPLLSYWHDLCVISNSLLCATDEAVLARLHWQLDNVNAAVESWQPEHSDQLAEQFGAAELVGLLAQAKAYRLGALLVAHRLRFPFGCGEDAQADIWSRELMAELELARRVAGRPLRFAALPFLVAAVEATGDASRRDVLCRVDCYVDHYAPPLRQVARVFLVKVWGERDLNLNGRWLDSIHKPCPVLAAVDAACF
ncbi:hypothetical protein B0T24DRAFT_56442 [Lasiosphaeria ovina]|uniref:Zn(2)-C6 fungal-type domain-containing protein n=1 Tax=Lasiosphaeria ovina TaxID=92902 RepID=A0AAE0TXV5_9PEZI|nr:hypothetical protein B0T24DRAFT_56442 [Lasiosphaeria ovina]